MCTVEINIIAVLPDESLAFSVGMSTFTVLSNFPLLKDTSSIRRIHCRNSCRN